MRLSAHAVLGKIILNSAVIFGLVLTILGARHALSDTIPISEKNLGTWSLTAYRHESTQAFSHCSLLSHYKSGTTIIFGFSPDGSWRIGWSNSTWSFSDKQRLKVTLGIDGAPPQPRSGIAKGRDIFFVELPVNSDFVRQLTASKTIVLEFDEQRLAFNSGTLENALPAGFSCVAQYQKATPGLSKTQEPAKPDVQTSNASSAAASRPEANEGRQKQAYRVEAQAYLSRLLGKAGFAKAEIVPDATLTSDARDNWHAVWKFGNLTGVLRVIDGGENETIESLFAATSADDIRTCGKGRYYSAAINSDINRKRSTCFADTSGWEVRYSIILRDSGGFYLAGVVGFFEEGDYGLIEFRETSAEVRDADYQLSKAIKITAQK